MNLFVTRIKKRYSSKVFEQFFNAILNRRKEVGLLNSNTTMTDSTLLVFILTLALNIKQAI